VPSKSVLIYVTLIIFVIIIIIIPPLAFRSTEISPILKKNSLDPAVVSNYRPISYLSYLSKLLDRAIKGQLLARLDGNGSLPECQSAYRTCHSTESALLKISSDALAAADVGMLTRLGLLDLSVAFDRLRRS
jgi:hypothetical protein